ncbi:MAG TPA: glycosyltransferase family 2 protein [Actinomycetota bacterium]|nr:glycosyltransferase family 2 protein [Actinomycetota bacterium]
MSADVSVVVAVLDNASTLQRCLDSIRSQEGPSVEAVVIDGGSTDGSLEVVRANAHWLSHWETGADRGIYSAWNKALQHVSGRWVAFLGADDYYLDGGAVRDLAELGDGEDSDLVCGRIWYVDRRGQRQFTHGQPWSWERMKRKHSVAHTGMLHRSELFRRFGSFDEDLRIAGDYEFLMRLGPSASASFLDRVYLAMGNEGVSSSHALDTLREVRRIQSRHPDIGPAAAWANFLREVAVHGYWQGRRALDRNPLVCALKSARRNARPAGGR